LVSGRDSNIQICAIEISGTDESCLTAISNNFTPAWSPDGQQIAFVSDRDGNQEIYMMGADGKTQERLTDNSAFDGMPSWSPNGQQIAFISERDGNPEIYVMYADGSGIQRLTMSEGRDIDAVWQPAN
jgi:TolB protein